jgi:hypothetical protein
MKFQLVAAAAVHALLACAPPAAAQATIDVRLGDIEYRRLARLAAFGLVDTSLVGQWPYSRREVARMVAEARRNLDSRGSHHGVAEPLLAALEHDLGAAERTAPMEAARLTVRATNAAPRRFPPDGLGSIDAWTSPVLGATGNEPIARGVAAMFETRHSFRAARWLVAEARPRIVTPSGARGGPDRAPVIDLEVAYLRAAVGRFALDAGRAELATGQSPLSSLGVSASSPPLLMVRLSNDLPLVLPLVSRITGPVRGTLFVADLGADQNFPHARLAGWKLNILPHRRLELGVTVLSQQGGGGAPPAAFRERVLDLLPLYDAIFVTDRDFEISNKLSGIEFRHRVPWRAIEVHGEMLIDDWDERRLTSTLWEDASYALGLTAPVGYGDGRLTLTAEAHHTGIRMYRHGDFTSGVATRGRLIGNPLGPFANAAYLRLTHDRGVGTLWEADGAYEFRSGRRHITSGGYGDETLRFHLTERLPAEYRRRLVVRSWSRLGGRYSAARDLRTLTEGGLEWVRNDAHTTSSRLNLLARLGAELRF